MKIGKVPESIRKRSIFRQIRTKREEVLCGAGLGEDCAIFAPAQGKVWTSCVQSGSLAAWRKPGETVGSGSFLGGSITRLIHKCANNLAASGSEPFAVSLALILPPSAPEEDLKAYMAEAEKACAALRMQIVGGHTEVSAAASEPIAAATGYGQAFPNQVCTTKGAVPGQAIVVSKWIGLEGTAALAKHYQEELFRRYPVYLVEEAAGFDRFFSVLPEAALAVKSNVRVMHDASSGGIFAALWELAESSGVGLTVDLKKLPIRQETVEICEYCGANPYELAGGGCLLMTTPEAPGLVRTLEENGIPAAVIGSITGSHDKIIVNEEEIRFLNRPS
ncbi:MAG: hydrogenase maturation factor [Clostridium sp.]|jgi:hydrogenase maturation factor|nr:hydrogenase maturation factor [Clostridium sp.]